MLHAFVNSHLVFNFNFTTTMSSTLINIFKINHEKKKPVDFEATRLGVVSYGFAQPKRTKDWRMSVVFYTYIKCGDKGCKIIIDNRSCINAKSLKYYSSFWLKTYSLS